jgi:hypothetical protein
LFDLPLEQAPELDGLVVAGEQQLGAGGGGAQPGDLVDLLVNFERAEIVKLLLVRLELVVETVLDVGVQLTVSAPADGL